MKSFGALCLSLLLFNTAFAQPEKAISNKDTYSWMFGASWTLTDDDGESFNPFLFENLHGHLFPTQLSIDKYIYNGWSVEFIMTYSKYNPEKSQMVLMVFQEIYSLWISMANIHYTNCSKTG